MLSKSAGRDSLGPQTSATRDNAGACLRGPRLRAAAGRGNHRGVQSVRHPPVRGPLIGSRVPPGPGPALSSPAAMPRWEAHADLYGRLRASGEISGDNRRESRNRGGLPRDMGRLNDIYLSRCPGGQFGRHIHHRFPCAHEMLGQCPARP